MMAHAAVQPHTKKQFCIEDFMPNKKRSPGMTDVDQIERALAAMAGVQIGAGVA